MTVLAFVDGLRSRKLARPLAIVSRCSSTPSRSTCRGCRSRRHRTGHRRSPRSIVIGMRQPACAPRTRSDVARQCSLCRARRLRSRSDRCRCIRRRPRLRHARLGRRDDERTDLAPLTAPQSVVRAAIEACSLPAPPYRRGLYADEDRSPSSCGFLPRVLGVFLSSASSIVICRKWLLDSPGRAP